MREESIVKRLEAIAPVRRDEPMALHTSFRIGGPADLFVVAKDLDQLRRLLCLAWEAQMPGFLLGSGTNILVSDWGIRGLVVENRARGLTSSQRPGRYWVESGAPLAHLARRVAGEGVAGLEWAVGIPGTVGGAVVYNAGAFGGCLADVLGSALVLNRDGTIEELDPSELGMGYRQSAFSSRNGPWAAILAVELVLSIESSAAIKGRLAQYTSQRRASQPRLPSAGSVFKNPPGYAAGWLIEHVGLKGYRQGDAQFSPKHANFIVNMGRASAFEVRDLMELAQDRVRERFGIRLEPEIEMVGEGIAR